MTRLTPSEFRAIRAKAEARKMRREEKRIENALLDAAKTAGNGPRTGVREQNGPGQAKRRKSRSERKSLVLALDAAFSVHIRSKWDRCPFCGGSVDHCFHFVTRAKYSVRWDDRNAVGSCRGCNLRYEFDPHFAIGWYIGNRGLSEYEELVRDGNRTAKKSNDELRARLDEIRSAISGTTSFGNGQRAGE